MADLRPYQVDGVRWIAEALTNRAASPGVMLADDMGLGKTRQAIEAIRKLGGETLVVAPAMARETWLAELAKCDILDVGIALPVGSKRARLAWEDLEQKRQSWVITSYELLPKLMQVRYAKKTPANLIVDEAHMLKGRNTKGKMSKRAGIVYEVACVVLRRLLLTGTPMADHPRDLYNLLVTMDGHKRRWGSPWDFDRKFCNGHSGEHGWENDGIGPEALGPLLNGLMLRREKRTVAEQVPPLQRLPIWLDGTPEGEAALERAMTVKSSANVQAALEATLMAKWDTAMDLATEARRFLLVTWMKEHAHDFWQQLNQAGTPCHLITGDMSTEKREAIAKRAAEEKVGVVATLDSVWQSIDALKHVASVGIMHALRPRWLQMAQGEARLHRMGRDLSEPVIWYYPLCRNTMDELVWRNIQGKIDQFREVIPESSEATALRDALNDNESLEDLYASM